MKNPKELCILSQDHEAIHSCPIAGGPIGELTCIELCSWADDIDNEERWWLEYMDKVKKYCKENLDITEEKVIARICCNCPAHYVDKE